MLWKRWFPVSGAAAQRQETDEPPERWVKQIREGDHELRNELIRRYRPYILKATSRFYRKYIDPERDDGFSVAMAAFDEAITHFSPDGGKMFLSFADTVIQRRLIDYTRKESRHASVVAFSAFETETEEGGEPFNPIEVRQAMEAYEETCAADERKLEIAELSDQLAHFGITFGDLVQCSPSHRDSREMLLEMGRKVAGSESMMAFIMEKRQLPVKELCLTEGVSRKTVDRHRKYLLAVCLIAYGSYPMLQEYIGLGPVGRREPS